MFTKWEFAWSNAVIEVRKVASSSQAVPWHLLVWCILGFCSIAVTVGMLPVFVSLLTPSATSMALCVSIVWSTTCDTDGAGSCLSSFFLFLVSLPFCLPSLPDCLLACRCLLAVKTPQMSSLPAHLTHWRYKSADLHLM